MPAITVLTFTEPLNTSCQVGDTAYYLNGSTAVGGFTSGLHTDIVEIGIITNITGLVITIGNSFVSAVPNGSFILFSKDNKVNLSSLLGYYAELKIVNASVEEAELFSVGVDTFESSK